MTSFFYYANYDTIVGSNRFLPCRQKNVLFALIKTFPLIFKSDAFTDKLIRFNQKELICIQFKRDVLYQNLTVWQIMHSVKSQNSIILQMILPFDAKICRAMVRESDIQ